MIFSSGDVPVHDRRACSRLSSFVSIPEPIHAYNAVLPSREAAPLGVPTIRCLMLQQGSPEH